MKDFLSLPRIASIASYVCLGALAYSGHVAASIGLIGSLAALLAHQFITDKDKEVKSVVSKVEFEELRSIVNSLTIKVGLSKVDRK